MELKKVKYLVKLQKVEPLTCIKSSNSLLEECVSTATVQLYQIGSAFGGGGGGLGFFGGGGRSIGLVFCHNPNPR